MKGVLALAVSRLILLVVADVELVLRNVVYGFLATLGWMALAGYATAWRLERRERFAIQGAHLPEHRITLDDGATQEQLEGEGAVRPRPTRLLGERYAAAWSTRPEALVRIAPPLLRSISTDILGIAAGMAALLGVVLLLVLAAALVRR
jgi:hypothetical protein